MFTKQKLSRRSCLKGISLGAGGLFFAPLLQKVAAAADGNVTPPKRRSQEQFFKNRDRNGDGVITLEEYIGNPKDRNVPALTKRFKKIDSNGDGKLQLDELKKQAK